jgi:hypothetical protein
MAHIKLPEGLPGIRGYAGLPDRLAAALGHDPSAARERSPR